MKDKILELGYPLSEVNELLKVSKNIKKDYELLKDNYPIQYLIGYVNFYGYKINVNDSVLIPRYETEYLVEKTIRYSHKIFNNKIKMVDLGTGSGCIAIALSKNINSDVSAIDISDNALEVARLNAHENGANIKFIKNDMLNNINDKYDLIISNPPYISSSEVIMEMVDKYEPHEALYAPNNGLYYYESILKNISNNLNDKFLIAFEIGYTQANDIKDIINKYLDNVNIIVEKDLSGKDRYIFITNE